VAPDQDEALQDDADQEDALHDDADHEDALQDDADHEDALHEDADHEDADHDEALHDDASNDTQSKPGCQELALQLLALNVFSPVLVEFRDLESLPFLVIDNKPAPARGSRGSPSAASRIAALACAGEAPGWSEK
jgi:hypothetical protein